MTNEQGNLAINSENIFPIIKKWLYSDHDIFIREVVSNACDAITKLKKLDLMSEASLPDDYKAKIEVEVNPEDKTITFTDNGLGMTADEVKEYINQIAFSGAADFLEKYKDKANEEQIIGHFGLGFYSVFMVADSAEIHTLSYKEGSEAVHWESDGGLTFEMGPSDKDTVGTRIILHLNEDSYEFANEYRVREVLDKYCSFMPTEIYVSKAEETEVQIIKPEEKLDSVEAGKSEWHGIISDFYGPFEKTLEKAEAMNLAIEEKIRAILGQYIYGVDYETLPEALGKRLKEKHLTIALAESCTGGLASSLLTDIPGSSEYLMGSVVSYTNDVKHRLLGVKQETLDTYTAVSEQTAREMAQGIRDRIGTDLGISITGIAGPGGGTPTQPVGLVYIGAADKNGTKVLECRFKAARTTIKLRAAMNALSLAMDRVKAL